MASAMQYLSVPDVGLGLFSDVNPMQIPFGGASQVSNFVWVDGYVRARPGINEAYTPAPDANPIAHLSLFTDFDATRQLMRLSRNGSNYALYRHNGSWVPVNLSIPGVSTDYPPTSCNFKGDWWFTTGDGNLYRFDGSVLSDVPALQANPALQAYRKPKIVVAGDSRIFIGDCLGDDNTTRIAYRVAWSDTLDGTTWRGGVGAGTSGLVDLGKGSAPITGMYFSNSILLVFKPTSIFMGYAAGPPTYYAFKEVVSGIGCIAHATIKQYREGILVWLGDDNIYVGGTSRQPTPVGDRIRPRLREITALTNISKAKAVIDRQNHLYTLFLPYVLDNKVNHFFTINLKNGSWWEGLYNVASVDITDGVEFRDNPWSTQQLLGNIDGKIFESSFSYKFDLGNVFGVNWVSGVVPGRTVTGGKTDQVSLQQARVNGVAGQLSFTYHVGQGLDRFQIRNLGQQVLDGTSNIYVSGRPEAAEHFKMQMSNTSAATTPMIAGLGIGHIPVGLNVKR